MRRSPLESFLNWIERLNILVFSVLGVIVIMQVTWRYAFNAPLFWIEELARCLFVWVVLLEVPILLHKGQQISINWFVNFVPLQGRRVIDVIAHALSGIFSVILMVAGIRLVLLSKRISTTSLGISWGALYSVIPIMAGLMLLVDLGAIRKDIAHASCRGDDQCGS